MKAGWILVCISLATLQAAEVFKWTDADGKVHYTDQPPAGKVGDKPLKIQSQDGVQEVSKKAMDDSAKKAKQDADAQASQKTSADNCKTAKSNLAVLQNPDPVYLQDGKGEKVLLGKEQRQKELDSANAAIKKFCTPS